MLWIRNDSDPDPSFQMVSNPYPDLDPVSVLTCICSQILIFITGIQHLHFRLASVLGLGCILRRDIRVLEFFYKKEFISFNC